MRRLPPLVGYPLHLSFESCLNNYRGKLLVGEPDRGSAVYAASMIRQRLIVLERELWNDRNLFALILSHEIFHFVWVRLGNQARKDYAAIVATECERRAVGELGDSSDVERSAIYRLPSVTDTRQWRNYICESFCDTAAWLYAGITDHQSFTLAARWRPPRAAWFARTFKGCWRC